MDNNARIMKELKELQEAARNVGEALLSCQDGTDSFSRHELWLGKINYSIARAIKDLSC